MNLYDMNFLQTLVDYNIYFQKIITDCRLLGIRHPGSLKCLNLIGCMCYNNITGSHKIYSRVHDLPFFYNFAANSEMNKPKHAKSEVTLSLTKTSPKL